MMNISAGKLTLILGALAFSYVAGCAQEEVFPKLGEGLASPIDIAVSEDKSHFYVLNADMDRKYNRGSILILNQDGDRVGKVDTPRLGRNLTIIGNTMVVGFAGIAGSDEFLNIVHVYDVTDPAAPSRKSEFVIDCQPLNAAGDEDYRYYVVTCKNGGLLIGDLEKGTLKQVRDYRFSRRAIYLDPERQLVFGFMSDIGGVDYKDAVMTDEASWSETFERSETPNEVPDSYETSKRSRRRFKQVQDQFRFFVYDIAAEEEEGFPLRGIDDEVVEKEMRWLYFTLTNVDGTPDDAAGFTNLKNKYYRANFWAAKPDPSNPNAFYLSHRGLGTSGDSPHANNIIHVTITADPRVGEDGKVPKTSSYLKFKRVFGFPGTQTTALNPAYLGDFALVNSMGEDLVIVNSFRDPANFQGGIAGGFAIAASTIAEPLWFDDHSSLDVKDSFFQMAVGSNGRIATCSFYGNAVIFLDVKLGTDITEVKRIE